MSHIGRWKKRAFQPFKAMWPSRRALHRRFWNFGTRCSLLHPMAELASKPLLEWEALLRIFIKKHPLYKPHCYRETVALHQSLFIVAPYKLSRPLLFFIKAMQLQYIFWDHELLFPSDAVYSRSLNILLTGAIIKENGKELHRCSEPDCTNRS